MKVIHLITRMIVGGAQENTLWNCLDQRSLFGDDVILMTGPETGSEGNLLDRHPTHGLNVVTVDAMRRSINPLNEWKAYWELRKAFQQLRPELVHTHSSKAGILGRAAAKSLGIPCVHTIHGAAFHFGQSKLAYHLYQFLEARAAGWCDRILCVADAMRDQYLKAGIGQPEQYTTIHSGFETTPYLKPQIDPQQTRKELGLSPEDVVIGKIARFFPLKGHDAILKIAAPVCQAHPNVKFLLVGDGPLRGEIEQTLTRLGVRDRFVLTGLVDPAEVPRYIHAMDVVLHTSQWEGLARVLPQGLLAAKPVVSFAIDGAPEVVIPDQTGFLIPRDDYQALNQAIDQLANDAELRQRLGHEGRKRFAEKFDHAYMTRRIRDVYLEVLDQKP